MQTQTTVEPLVTVDELADFLRKPRSWIYNAYLRDQTAPKLKVGNHYRFRMSEVEQWLEGRQAV